MIGGMLADIGASLLMFLAFCVDWSGRRALRAAVRTWRGAQRRMRDAQEWERRWAWTHSAQARANGRAFRELAEGGRWPTGELDLAEDTGEIEHYSTSAEGLKPCKADCVICQVGPNPFPGEVDHG